MIKALPVAVSSLQQSGTEDGSLLPRSAMIAGRSRLCSILLISIIRRDIGGSM